ncbi:hypothetical protein FOMPIDRAFT_91473 [Fomitopsis schrenkii]|uniref:Fungal-type protein kinase domain-containing protein n=1 Tax=Fomitopsis schrenkii TaxID=2126942 RepID=S8DRQ3_FOMSC|nr:hypothetical protein FOMPIDRAFT_91473 [Fomitopsis schrenkii]
MGTSADRQLAFRLASGLGAEWEQTAETRKAVRRITMTDEQEKKVTYLAFRLLFINPELFSRATLVWEAFRLDDNGQSSLDERYVVKEAWREYHYRISETEFYRVLRTDGVTHGVALYAHGEDLGIGDSRLRQQDVKARAAGQPLVGADRKSGHLTLSGFHNDATKKHYNERSQVRICLHTVGTPLADFQSTRELIVAFRDAVEGHRQAYELGGVIHRDISEGNVMMARHSASFRGFIHDFDYSFSWRRFLRKRGMRACLAEWEKYCRDHGKEPYDKEKPDESKVRTGTKLFMAIEILSSEVTHEARHDLEAFYWLLVYILLRHTNHGHSRGKAAFDALFTVVSWDQASDLKFSWITYPAVPLTVPGNAPLNALLEGFREALILALFDQALAVEDWPKDDAALKWVPPANMYITEDVEASSGMLTTKGTRDDSTATHTLVPLPEEPGFMGAREDELADAAGAAIAQGPTSEVLGSQQMDTETQAFGRGNSAQVPLPAQTVAGASHTPHLPATEHTLGAAGLSPQLPAPDNQPPALYIEAEAPDLVADERPKSRTRTRSTRRAELPEGPGRTRRVTRKTAASRKAAETGLASKAEGDREEPARRYNLRSSNRREPAVSTTLESAGPALPENHRVTRSRSRAAAQATTAGSASLRSRVARKRSRAEEGLDGLEENVESRMSKRQRTLNQPRLPKPSKKSGSKP